MLTDKQKEIRKAGITGSEIAAVAGVSPYQTPLDVWAKKVGLVDDENSPAMERGSYLEDGICRWYAATTGALLTDPGTIVHQKYPLVIATPDRVASFVGKESVGLEAKAPTWRTFRQWGEAGTDHVPQHYIPQCQWEAAVLEVSRIDVAADLGDHLGIWTVKYDEDLFQSLLEKAERFWRDFVITKKQPPATGSEHETLKKLFPLSKVTDYMDATDDVARAVEEYRTAKKSAAEWESKVDMIEARLKQAIGDRSGIKGGFGRIDFKNNKDSVATDWKSLALELHATEGQIAKYTTTKPGARPFRVYFTRSK